MRVVFHFRCLKLKRQRKPCGQLILINFAFCRNLFVGLSQQSLGNRQETSLDVWSARATQGGSEFPVNLHVDVGPWVKKKKKKRKLGEKKKTIQTCSQSPDSNFCDPILLTAGPTFINHIFFPLVLPSCLFWYRDFHKARHCLFGSLNDKVQVQV